MDRAKCCAVWQDGMICHRHWVALWHTTYTQFLRWSKLVSGIGAGYNLARSAISRNMIPDSTTIWAHQHTAGAKKHDPQALGCLLRESAIAYVNKLIEFEKIIQSISYSSSYSFCLGLFLFNRIEMGGISLKIRQDIPCFTDQI